MPQIPTYEGPQVRERALQPVYQRTPDVSSGLQALARAASDIGGVAERAAQRDATAEADRIDAEVTGGWLEWDAANRRKYQGQNAGAYEAEARAWWDKAAQKHASAPAIVREKVGTHLGRKRDQALGSVLGYVNAERERFADDAHEAAAQASVEMAVDTGDTAGGAARVRELAAAKGARKGWSTEMVQAEQQRLLGTLHLMAINRLADKDPVKAEAYYQANRGEIPAAAQGRVEQVLKAEGDNQFATRFVAEVAGKPLADQLAEAAKIEDPERRQKATVRVKEGYALSRQVTQEREAAAADEAWQMVGKGQRVPEAVLSRMDGRARVQLQEHIADRAERLARAAEGRESKVKTDWNTYVELRERLAGGEKVDLRAYTEKLAGPQLEQLLDLQGRTEKPKAVKEVATANQQIGALVKQLNLTGQRHNEKRGQLESAAHDLFNEYKERHGRLPDYEARQAILDKLVVETVTKPGMIWDTKGPAYTLPRDDLRKRVLDTMPAATSGDKFTPGKTYTDKDGNRARYKGAGQWEPL